MIEFVIKEIQEKTLRCMSHAYMKDIHPKSTIFSFFIYPSG